VVVGTDVANRNHLHTEGLIGFFVNQLVLRTEVRGEQTVRELLREVRETTLEAYEHQDVPFERLVEELSPERDLSRHPLFQVKLVLQDARNAKVDVNSLSIGELSFDFPIVKYDLSVQLAEISDGLHGTLEYSSDIFTAGSVKWLLSLYESFLNKLTSPDNMDRCINELLADDEIQLRQRGQDQQYELFRTRTPRDRRKQVVSV
jgi:non-ribosomal peptide synthetase component F